jgi:hypothetical protein
MTPTEIRTALETLNQTILAWAVTSPHSEPAAYDRYLWRAIEQSGALLSALPGETAPYDTGAAASLADVVTLSGDTGPAPPRALVEVVREMQYESFDEQLDRLRDFTMDIANGLRSIEAADYDAIRELLNRYTEVIAIARELVTEGHLAARAILATHARP